MRSKRLDRIQLIAAISSKGRGWIQIGFGNNNSDTFWHFILQLTKILEAENKNWREETRIMLDNAKYHKSRVNMRRYNKLEIPVFFLGPYSFDVAAIERLFANIKRNDLNPKNHNFENRLNKGRYLVWLAEEVRKLKLGDFKTYFRSSLLAAEKHFLFQNI